MSYKREELEITPDTSRKTKRHLWNAASDLATSIHFNNLGDSVAYDTLTSLRVLITLDTDTTAETQELILESLSQESAHI